MTEANSTICGATREELLRRRYEAMTSFEQRRVAYLAELAGCTVEEAIELGFGERPQYNLASPYGHGVLR